ncbi:hypothetical protein SLA2020_024650 [Shorea laevis]
MASSFPYFLFLFVALHFFVSASSAKATFEPDAFTLPVKKDNATLQYTTTIKIGANASSINVAIDIGGQLLWFDCEVGYNSSAFHYIQCGTAECDAEGAAVYCKICFPLPNLPPCTLATCGIDHYNPFIIGTGSISGTGSSGDLAKDTLTINSTDVRGRRKRDKVPIHVPLFSFSCVPSKDIRDLASGALGIIGLGNTPTSLPMQLFSMFNISKEFSMCLPSTSQTTGNILIGSSNKTTSYRDLLMTTPLLINPVSEYPFPDSLPSFDYFIGVTSINVNGQNVSLNSSLLSFDNEEGVGGTKISTATPYTVLHTDIYNPLLDKFVKSATTLKIERVASVSPFGACFNSKTIHKIGEELHVPTINLVLQNNTVYWRIYGHNSMVRVKKGVMCLAFVDGGSNLRTSIVIGGHQLENNFLEFNLASLELRFSSSLFVKSRSCSHLGGYYLN